MKFSENWLRAFVNPSLNSEALAHALTMAGLEVEAMENVAPAFDKIVVGLVLSTEQHPNADRLKLTQVDVGGATPLAIVCGAPNVVPGMKVPCALVGAELPGISIKQAKVRGVESNGMLCSEKELGLSEESNGLMALPADAPIGASIRDYLDLNDKLFTLKLTPNRADCLSLNGIAREVSALTGAPIKPVEIKTISATIQDTRSITLAADQACPRYSGRVIKLKNPQAPTPDWMKRRIVRSGLRCISAVVDVTNYVMLELGQPLHAFDNAKLSGGISVRMARAGEKLTLLNQQAVSLQPDMLVIADDAQALALAGVMGGATSEFGDSSTAVFLESAFFSPDAIAGMTRRLTLNSDAAFRFERGVDFNLTPQALERATQLLLEICGGEAGPIAEKLAALPTRAPVKVRPDRLRKVLGFEISDKEIINVFNKLRFEHKVNSGIISVTPPSHRFDLAIEEDYAEEVVRIHGYDNIPAKPPKAVVAMLPQNETSRRLSDLRDILVARDYQEVVNYSFVDETSERDFGRCPQPIKLQNPIASNMNVMRTTLWGGLINTLIFNLNRKESRVRIFEAGRCFEGNGVDQQRYQIGGLAYGTAAPEQWGIATRKIDFFDVKADLEMLCAGMTLAFTPLQHKSLHPGRAAQVLVNGKAMGFIGELHPKLVQQYQLIQAPVLFELDVRAVLPSRLPKYSEVSRFPQVSRDLAIVVDETAAVDGILSLVRSNAPVVGTHVLLFDIYRGPGVQKGKKSLAFRVVIQDTERTYTDDEVDGVIAKIVDALQGGYGAELRS
ncbi:MAG: phenylalanine--tRNA ligase subunit beta [Burkholderiales bacterium]